MKKASIPEWVTGFVDAEGCFFVGVHKHPGTSTGYRIQVEFSVKQHSKDIDLLYALKQHFQCGSVGVNKQNIAYWRVSKVSDLLNHVRPHFERYPLQTKRSVEFTKFVEICTLLQDRVHWTPEGFEQVRSLVPALRHPRTGEPGEGPPVRSYGKLHPQWIVGFFDGEGCFSASISDRGVVSCSISVKQGAVDLGLLKGLRDYFGCGSVHLDPRTNVAVWIVNGKNQLRQHVLPFFEKHPLKSKRNVEFKRFRKLCLESKRINQYSASEIAVLRERVRDLHAEPAEDQ